jgi:SAM-dependent methyltransferase
MTTEFDAYAHGYNAGMENPVKALLGRSPDDFLAIKVDWLLRTAPGLEIAESNFRVLDYGCGTTHFLRLLMQRIPRARFAGCDVSAAMLEEAARIWPDSAARPELTLINGSRAPFPDQTFDLVVISAVLHHIPPADRPVVYSELNRLLRPKGRIVVFEHNPLNPVTRYVVARTPIDSNANLLHAKEVQAGLRAVGFGAPTIAYLMFCPPRFSFAARLDSAFHWLPLGAQYAVLAERLA